MNFESVVPQESTLAADAVLLDEYSDEQLEAAAGEPVYLGTSTGKACTCPDC